MTRSLLFALVVSLGIHLSAACLSYWLHTWHKGITVRERAVANPSPPKPLSIILRQATAPTNNQAEGLPDLQAGETVSAIREKPEIYPSQPSDNGEKSDELVAPRFISPPNFSFVEFYPQKLKTQLTFRVYVTSAGLPERVEPVGSYALPADLLDHLTKTLYRARFHPATQAGNSVSAYLDIVIGVEPETEPQ